ncbi:MAG: amidohydrolase family protein [Bacteroidetes bacterium]|nr:amidohydrolase family protein [Bacteroidota bacterium]
MRIDAHQHFWNYDSVRDAWMTDDMGAIKKNFGASDLKPKLDNLSIDGTVLVQVQQDLQENVWLLNIARQHSFVKGVVGWIDFTAPDLKQQLEKLSGEGLLKGFRHIVQSEKDPEFLNRPQFLNGVRTLADFRFTYDVLIYHHQLPMAVKFAQALDGQPLVLDHIAKPDIRSGNWKSWSDGIKSLALLPHVFCKISGMVTEANWLGWKEEDFKVYLDVVTEAFGPARMMYGSDWPVCELAGGYDAQYKIVSNYFSSFSADEQACIFGLNAARFYKL